MDYPNPYGSEPRINKRLAYPRFTSGSLPVDPCWSLSDADKIKCCCKPGIGVDSQLASPYASPATILLASLLARGIKH